MEKITLILFGVLLFITTIIILYYLYSKKRKRITNIIIILLFIIPIVWIFIGSVTQTEDFDCSRGECDCGDGKCDIGEVCQQDCYIPPPPYCGDGICQASRGEDKYGCPLDCGLPLPICGDGKCEVFHYSPNLPPYSSDTIDEFEVCPQDCGIICGDGECVIDPYDERRNCPSDCHISISCGNSICQEGESQMSCPSDCKQQVNNADLIYKLNQKQRPLVGGLQIEMTRNSGVAYCSLGAIVNYNGKNYVLTAGHCVTKGNDGFPDPEDIGLTYKQGGEVVGQVYKTDFTGGVDIALLSINSGIGNEQKDFLGNKIEGFGTASIGLKVYKIGRTTGLTYGTINEWVGYTGSDGKKWNGFEVKGDNGKFSESGDSGSAIITVSSPHRIVGIISAGDGSNMPEDIKSKLGL